MIQTDGCFPEPPADLGFFMNEQRGPIEEAIQVLLNGEAPCWERDVEKGLDLPIPNLLGHLNFQRLILAEAGFRMNRGDGSSVGPLLEASWVLNQSILSRTELISYLIALTVLKVQLAIVRRSHSDPAIWKERLGGLNLESVFFDTLQGEAWYFQRYMRIGSIWDMEMPTVRYLVNPISNPFMRLGIISYSDAMRGAIQDLPNREICQVESASYSAEMMNGIPRWNIISRIAIPNIDDAWVRTVRVSLGIDLTNRVINAQELLDSGASAVLRSQVGREPSDIPSFSWNYSVDTDALTIALDSEPYTSAPPIYTRLPLRYSLSLREPQ